MKSKINQDRLTKSYGLTNAHAKVKSYEKRQLKFKYHLLLRRKSYILKNYFNLLYFISLKESIIIKQKVLFFKRKSYLFKRKSYFFKGKSYFITRKYYYVKRKFYDVRQVSFIYSKEIIKSLMALYRVWHAGLLHKLKSYGISGQIFGLNSSFLSNRWLQVVLDGKSSQEYPVNAGISSRLHTWS